MDLKWNPVKAQLREADTNSASHSSSLLPPRTRFTPQQEREYNNLRKDNAMNLMQYRVVPLILLVTSVYLFIGEWAGPNFFWRFNSIASAVAAVTWMIVLRCCPKHLKFSDQLSLLWALHFIWYQSMTHNRVVSMFQYSDDTHRPCWEPEQDVNNEEKAVLWQLVAVIGSTNLRVMSPSHATVLSILAPIIWSLQAIVLGSVYSPNGLFRILILYCVSSALALVGARHADTQLRYRFLETLRLKSERSVVHNIMQHVSVPIAIVSPGFKDGSSSKKNAGDQLVQRVALWNDTLAEITSLKVLDGSLLSDITPLKNGKALEDALWRALDPEGPETTRKLLLPIIKGSTITWLQVDVWPMQVDAQEQNVTPQAMIIGSDVTEFVSKNQSLLHVVGDKDDNLERMLQDAVGEKVLSELEDGSFLSRDPVQETNFPKSSGLSELLTLSVSSTSEGGGKQDPMATDAAKVRATLSTNGPPKVECKEQGTDPLLVWSSGGWKCQRCAKPPRPKEANPRTRQVPSGPSFEAPSVGSKSNDTDRTGTKGSSSLGTEDLEQHIFDDGPAQLSAFKLTPVETLVFSISEVMRHWNLSRGGVGKCCPWHIATEAAKLSIKKLHRMPCNPLWVPHSGVQCALCRCLSSHAGVPGYEDVGCLICGEELLPSRSPARAGPVSLSPDTCSSHEGSMVQSNEDSPPVSLDVVLSRLDQNAVSRDRQQIVISL